MENPSSFAMLSIAKSVSSKSGNSIIIHCITLNLVPSIRGVPGIDLTSNYLWFPVIPTYNNFLPSHLVVKRYSLKSIVIPAQNSWNYVVRNAINSEDWWNLIKSAATNEDRVSGLVWNWFRHVQHRWIEWLLNYCWKCKVKDKEIDWLFNRKDQY